MSNKIRIRTKRPWIAYPGSTLQQNYAEDLNHGFLLWEIQSKGSFDVSFCELPNPKPFVTIEWQGNVNRTMQLATMFKKGSRFRIKSKHHISQKDVQQLVFLLKTTCNATEVVFKSEYQSSLGDALLQKGDITVVRNDLRNVDVLYSLLKDFNAHAELTSKEWDHIYEKLHEYVNSLSGETVIRNVSWSLRKMEFDNLFCYGEDNVIDFEKMSGIVGIFSENRRGKSSIPGAIMYTLFNATDRGSIKNMHVCNTRKQYCSSKITVDISGKRHLIERITSKTENKHGKINSSTALNFFEQTDNGPLELNAEQRTSTDKEIRKRIGTADDFLLTGFSAQGEINEFITQGPSKRWQVISRFLDLDVFKQLHDLAKNDVNDYKAVLNTMPDRDWQSLQNELKNSVQKNDVQLALINNTLHDLNMRLRELQSKVSSHHGVIVTQSDITKQEEQISYLENNLSKHDLEQKNIKKQIDDISDKLKKIEDVKSQNDLDNMKKMLASYKKLQSSLESLRASHSNDSSRLKNTKRTLKILQKVPCGDQFPTCTFIKDAHNLKDKLELHEARAQKSKKAVEEASTSLAQLEKLVDVAKIEKLESLFALQPRYELEKSQLELKLHKEESQSASVKSDLELAMSRLKKLQDSFNNDENFELVSIRNDVDAIKQKIVAQEQLKLQIATTNGKLYSQMESYTHEEHERLKYLSLMKTSELVMHGFSKKGVPNTIVATQLPKINDEINKILNGIVDFTLELEKDEEGDNIDAFINYGDSRRIIELGSGMEKMIASIALRVALINVSSVPKSDMLIIDEGFGSLDDTNTEACNRLLISLKRYFRIVLVITHQDAVKDVADQIIEISKNEKDSCIRYV